jgi:hypothetical protein
VTIEPGAQPTLELYVCDDPLAPELEEINCSRLESRHGWCLVTPNADVA